MKATKIWFDEFINVEMDDGKVLSQSLRWYPILRKASTEERENFRFTESGIRWEAIDEDVSLESFEYDDPTGKTPLRVFFDSMPELNISKIASRMGIRQSVFASYICGAKKPSAARLDEIEKTLHELGRELLAASL